MARIRTHPGEVLREESMKRLGLSANALALARRVPATRIGDILRMEKRRAVTADTAIRLARHFGTTPEFSRGGTPPRPALSPVTGER
jgi:antitoxin HigA-1